MKFPPPFDNPLVDLLLVYTALVLLFTIVRTWYSINVRKTIVLHPDRHERKSYRQVNLLRLAGFLICVVIFAITVAGVIPWAPGIVIALMGFNIGLTAQAFYMI